MVSHSHSGISNSFHCATGPAGIPPLNDLGTSLNWAWVRETSSVIDDACWKQVWAEMTDSRLETRLFTYLWLSFNTPNSHAGRVAQLIEEAERRGQTGMVERTRAKAEATQEARGGP